MAETAGVMERPAGTKKAPKAARQKQPQGTGRRRGGRKARATTPKRSSSRNSMGLSIRGEEAAVRFLERRGYGILDRNWSCFAGEADIVARDGDTLVFVEVKTRKGAENGFPNEAISAKKRDRYERIALAYVGEYDAVDAPIRFDIVSVVAVNKNRAMLRHHIDAFSVS